MPHSVLVGLYPGASNRLCKGSRGGRSDEGERLTVEFPPIVLIFRGWDCLHCGSGYLAQNTRLHVYIAVGLG